MIELLIVRDIDCWAILNEIAGYRCIRIIHKLPGDSGIFQGLCLGDFVDCAACFLKNRGPGINHCEGCDEEGCGFDVVDDSGGNLDSLTEPHIVALKAAANGSIHSAITIWDEGAIDFFI